MKNLWKIIGILALCFAFMGNNGGCNGIKTETVSASGVKKATVQVKTDAAGFTVEQNNIARRLQMDSVPGAIKHLYIISPYSGQALIYSTVKGKVTSSGKRLTPRSVASLDGQYVGERHAGMPVEIGGRQYRTPEVIEDDGSFGSSVEYVYWWDARDIYHQHFFTGGQIIHLSDQPLPIKGVVLNMELTTKAAE